MQKAADLVMRQRGAAIAVDRKIHDIKMAEANAITLDDELDRRTLAVDESARKLATLQAALDENTRTREAASAELDEMDRAIEHIKRRRQEARDACEALESKRGEIVEEYNDQGDDHGIYLSRVTDTETKIKELKTTLKTLTESHKAATAESAQVKEAIDEFASASSLHAQTMALKTDTAAAAAIADAIAITTDPHRHNNYHTDARLTVTGSVPDFAINTDGTLIDCVICFDDLAAKPIYVSTCKHAVHHACAHNTLMYTSENLALAENQQKYKCPACNAVSVFSEGGTILHATK